MLNNLSIGKRLLLVALLPLLLFAAFAVPKILSDRADASDAADNQDRAIVSALTWQVFDTVRAEAVANQDAASVSGFEFTTERDDTDAAIEAWKAGVGRFSTIDENALGNVLDDFNGHRLSFADDGPEAAYEADTALLRTIAAFDGLLAQGATSDSVELRNGADLTTVAEAAAELQILGAWASHESIAPEQLAGAAAAALETADAYALRTGQDLPPTGSYSDITEEFLSIAPGGDVGVSPNNWRDASEARSIELIDARDALGRAASTAALEAQNGASGSLRNGALMLLAGLLVAGVIATLVAKGIKESLNELRDEASNVANSDLPRLGEALSSGLPVGDLAADREVLEVTNNEFGEIASSLAAVRESAAGVGDRVAALQTGIADTFVNLARRNQALVDRQLEAIDTLEAEERDSDRLALMYRVDHLATRMRRNAESLLVLADAKSPERHSSPVQLREVLRVAIGEVEDYRRIVPISLDDLPVAGHRAQDLAHLLAELMENAAQHSPPGTAVDVLGARDVGTGDYTINIIDRGTGIEPTQLQSLNELLERPPSSTMTISHSIGLQVVSRLASALRVSVQLHEGDEGGLVALVTLPEAVIAEWSSNTPPRVPETRPVAAPTPDVPAPAEAAPAPMPAPVAEHAPAPAPIAEQAPAEAAAAPMPAPAPQPEPAPVAEVTPPLEIPELPTADEAPAALEPVMDSFEGLSMPAADPVPTIEMPELDLPSFGAPVDEAPVEAPSLELPDLGVAPVEAPSLELPDLGVAPVETPTPTATNPFEEIANVGGMFSADDVPDVPDFGSDMPDAPAPDFVPEVFEPVVEAPAPMPTPQPMAEAPAPMPTPQPMAEAPAPMPTPQPMAEAPAPMPTPQPETTSSGLTRRTRTASAEPPVDLNVDRTAPSQRTPDQVKNMLSRYKTGLERGRGAAETDGES